MHAKNIIVPIIAFLSFACCKSEKTPSVQVVPVTSASVAPIVKPVVQTEQELFIRSLVASDNSTDAFNLCKPKMVAEVTNAHSQGYGFFVAWAMNHEDVFKFKDVSVASNETNSGKVFKNFEKELGKKICVSGIVIQIEEEKNASEGLLKSGGTLFHFTNIGDSGDITRLNTARFCGVVAGLFHYTNSGGGTGHAIDTVGVWDLPENKK